MSKKSFTAILPRCDSDIGADGMAAVFNNAADLSKTVKISEIRTVPRARNVDNTNPLGNQGIISLDRISAFSGGTVLTPIAHDTASAGLPAQVQMVANPDSVTSTATIRRFGDCISSLAVTRAISFQAMLRAPNIIDTNDHSGRTCESHNIWHADGDTNTEPLVLNAGEGFALIRKEFGLPQAFHLGVTIRVVSTSATYKWSEADVGSVLLKGMASVALMNGSGSGVVLQVMIVSLPDMGEDNIPSFRIVRVAGAGSIDIEWPGSAETVVGHDTASVLTDVVALRGPVRLLPVSGRNGMQIDYHNYQNTPITTVMQQRADAFRRWLGAGPYIVETGTVTLDPAVLSRGEFEVWPGDRRGANNLTEIVLHPGEGIAVIGGGNGLIETSEQAYLDIEIMGYLDEPDAVYPVADNVRDGVNYGPTGADYNGDLVLPGIADVKKDVKYGADGTEFTGTLEAGTGTGKRRIRFIGTR